MTVQLTREERARSWLVEHYRRQRSTPLRAVGPIGLVAMGIVMLVRQPTPVAWIALAWGSFVLLRPIVVALRMRFERAPERSFVVTVDARGIEIGGAKGNALVPWSDVTASGLGSDYLWFEIRRGARATIPFRVMNDRVALEALFAQHAALRH